jgi:hypothetical protein
MYWETIRLFKKNTFESVHKSYELWCTFSVTVTIIFILQMLSFYSVSEKQHKKEGGSRAVAKSAQWF